MNALEFIGGVPKLIVPDQPRALIARPDRYRPTSFCDSPLKVGFLETVVARKMHLKGRCSTPRPARLFWVRPR